MKKLLVISAIVISFQSSLWATRPGVGDPTLPGKIRESNLKNIQELFDLVRREGSVAGKDRILHRDFQLGDFRGRVFLKAPNVARPKFLTVAANAKATLNFGDAPGLNLVKGILNAVVNFELARSGQAKLNETRFSLSGGTLGLIFGANPERIVVGGGTIGEGTKIGWADLSRKFNADGAPSLVRAILGKEPKAFGTLKTAALRLARR